MKAWLVNTGEPLPLDTEHRTGRTGMLARRLLAAGHQVDWWGTTFSHARKRHWSLRSETVEKAPGFRVHMVHGPGYRRNISLQRLIHQRTVASRLKPLLEDALRNAGAPDIIVSSMPTIELLPGGHPLRRRARDSRRHQSPRHVAGHLPGAAAPRAPSARPTGDRAAAPGSLRQVCREAQALWGITPGFVDWGLGVSGRPRTPLDRHFWHSYSSEASRPSAEALREAEAFWDAQGVGGTGGFVIAYGGVMSDTFDMETVFRAARLLREQDLRVQFVLCGSGDRLESYRQSARELENVLLPGWMDRARLQVLLRRASVGLAPYRSRRDFVISIPNKPIEYWAAGLPVLSSLQGVLSELIDRERCGLNYREGDAADLAARVRRLYDEPELRRSMADRARTVFENTFSEERVLGDMVAELEKIAKLRPRPAAHGLKATVAPATPA